MCMYLIRVRNHAVCLDGDPQEFLRDTLEEAIEETILIVSKGANRVGIVVEHFPRQCVQPENVILSFYSGNGESIRFTDYRKLEIEERFGVLHSNYPAGAKRLYQD